jgi:hypothetical protein
VVDELSTAAVASAIAASISRCFEPKWRITERVLQPARAATRSSEGSGSCSSRNSEIAASRIARRVAAVDSARRAWL